MRSTFGGFFIESGHEGFDDSHGSNRSRLPPGVRTTNVECPNQVMDSFCIVEFTIYELENWIVGLWDRKPCTVTSATRTKNQPNRACPVSKCGTNQRA